MLSTQRDFYWFELKLKMSWMHWGLSLVVTVSRQWGLLRCNKVIQSLSWSCKRDARTRHGHDRWHELIISDVTHVGSDGQGTQQHGAVLRIWEKIKIPTLRWEVTSMTLFDLYQPRLTVIATKYVEMMTASNLQKYCVGIFTRFLFKRHLDNGEHEKLWRKAGVINEIH